MSNNSIYQGQNEEIAALKDRVEELEILLSRLRQSNKQTYDELKEQIGIEKGRRWQEGRRADAAQREVQTLSEQNKALNMMIEAYRISPGNASSGSETVQNYIQELYQKVEQLRKARHDLNNQLAALLGIIEFFIPSEDALKELAQMGDEVLVMHWPRKITVGIFRDLAMITQGIWEHQKIT